MCDLILVLLQLFSYYYVSVYSQSETFTEELLVKPLYSEQIYTHFHFATVLNTDPNTENFHHTNLFPRALGEIIDRHHVQELHLTLTGGLWRYESWGYPVRDAAPGAELAVWFKPDTPNVETEWKGLAHSLSGLICASLNFIEAFNSLSPQYSLKPTGIVGEQSTNSSFLRYASLPREIVCTENLTPWKKLLPCDSKSGLASLLQSGHIHNTRYHSLGVHVRPICRDNSCTELSLELQQTVDLVYDYGILGSRNWSFKRFFGQGILGSCPLAKESVIYVDISANRSTPFQLNPVPDDYITSVRGGSESTYAKYKVKPYPMSIGAVYSSKPSVLINPLPPIHANQYITGYGQERGGVVTKIYNNQWKALDVVVLQNFPWFVPVYLHTLKIQSNGNSIRPLHKIYIPGKERVRPYYLELLLRLPPRSTTVISIDFDYVFLKWQEYPPDANHGFYIGSAIVSSYLPVARNFTGLPQDGTKISSAFNASRSGYLVQVRTEAMIITLPTPDFSMPYNVICLACTVVALAFGPLHNITTKRLLLKVDSKDNIFTKIKNKLLRKKETEEKVDEQ